MLLPSPTKATFKPLKLSLVLDQREAVGQHLAGMDSSESALITGTVA